MRNSIQTEREETRSEFLDLVENYFVEKNRDEEILKKIYVSMGKVLLPRFSRMISVNVITAEDIYNETWFSIIDPETPDYDPEKGSFIGYFIYVARNKILNWNFRKENENVDYDKIKKEIADKLAPDSELFDKELKVMFYESVNKLSALQREILVFRNLGYSFKELSTIFNASEEALRRRASTAKKKLGADGRLKKLFKILRDD